MKAQCNKCHQIFDTSELSEDVHQRHISPCCKTSYHILDPKLDKFFENYLKINEDPRYYEY